MKLIWFKRADGLWNMDCACGASGGGVKLEERAEFEEWHFKKIAEDRAYDQKKNYRGPGSAIDRPACGPKFPEPDLNDPRPFEFA